MKAPFRRGQRLILKCPTTWGPPNVRGTECEVIYCSWMGFARSTIIMVRLPGVKTKKFPAHVNDVRPV